jgi:DNA-binding CsgD family transcriptional regulator
MTLALPPFKVGGEPGSMVGRDQELASLVSRLTGPEGSAAVIIGAAGVGKTRLATETAAVAAAAGMNVIKVLATRASASIPFGAFVPYVASEGPATNRLALMRAIAASIKERASGLRLLVVVDDAHLLDDGSAALLLHLVSAEGISALATVRGGEECPDAVSALWKDRGGVRLDLAPLSESYTRELIEDFLGGKADRRLAHSTFARTLGNPLFTRELLRGSLAAGHVALDDGRWRITGADVPSPRLMELLTARLQGLSATEQRALGLVALGQPLHLSLLSELCGYTAVVALEARQLVEVKAAADGDGRVQLAHPLYDDAVRVGLGEAQRRALSAQLAAELERRGGVEEQDLLRVATWRLAAGSTNVALLTRAAHAANRLFDYPVAARLADAALQAGAGASAALAFARAEARRNRFADAERALSLVEGQVDSEEHAEQQLIERLPLLIWALDRPLDAVALLDRARDWWPSRSWRQFLDAWRVMLLQDNGQMVAAASIGEQLVTEGDLDPRVRLMVSFPVPVALLMIGRTRAAQAVSDSCFELAREWAPRARELAWGPLAAWVAVRLEAGREWAHIASLVAVGHDHALRSGDEELLSLLNLTIGRIALARGDLETARESLMDCTARFEESDPRHALVPSVAMLARVEAHAGRLDAAESALARGHAAARGREESWRRHELALADAWVTAGRGELRLAQRLALEAAGRCGERVTQRAAALHEALRLGAPAAAIAAELAAIAAVTDAEIAHTFARHASALEAGSASGLEQAAMEFEQIGALLRASEAAAAAAFAHERDGREDSARRCRARARALAAACPGLASNTVAAPEEEILTPREREIARLAARGRSNGGIADLLGVSVRTVETHLYRVFQKLGITHRGELTELLPP